VDDRSNDPRYWRDKAASFRAQANKLLARAGEFDDMAARMEAEYGADGSLEDATVRGRLNRLLHRPGKPKPAPASIPIQQPGLRVVR